jgi:hypothetical protein
MPHKFPIDETAPRPHWRAFTDEIEHKKRYDRDGKRERHVVGTSAILPFSETTGAVLIVDMVLW